MIYYKIKARYGIYGVYIRGVQKSAGTQSEARNRITDAGTRLYFEKDN
ncbi:hypothetical protein CE91St61_10500 [Lachnospiraceae bacterium]|nr:hypothetical protein CE91St61_10500 [Lachnospiraceae bacterium]